MSEKKILYLGNKLAAKGKTPTLIDTLSPSLMAEGISIVAVSAIENKLFRIADMLFTVFKYRNSAKAVLIDTYSTQNFMYAFLVAKLCRIYQIPYYPILHGGNLPKRLKSSPKASKELFGKASTNISPSRYLLESFKKNGFKNLLYIPNSIKIEEYPFFLRREVGPKILWVRSFSEIYNPMLALTIVEKLRAAGLKPTLCMVGPDKDGSLQKCKDEAAKNNLDIRFTGKLEKQEWIEISREYDIFLNTTNFDNMPVSIIEAMALGLVVISTNVGGMPFLIEDKVDGILIPPRNAQFFVDEIQKLLANPEIGKQMAENARLKVETYDWQIVKHSWFKLLDS